MKRKIVLLICLFCLFTAKAEYFRNLSLEDGLSQPSVLSITQDGLGRMWFGTREGINMYDGERITYIKGFAANGEENDLWIGNYVSTVVSNEEGNVFFLADKNLFGYDIHEVRFKQYTTGNVTDAIAAYQQEIWYTRNDSLFIYDSEKRKTIYQHKIPHQTVNTITVGEKYIYVGTTNGAYLFSREMNEKAEHLLKGVDIYHIFESSTGEIWIGTRMQGLFRLKNGIISEAPYDKDGTKGIRSLRIRAFAEDNMQNIWFGTFAGLQKYDTQLSTYSHLQIPYHVGGLHHPSIFSLYKDRQGNIWIGSYYGGISYFNPEKNGFVHYDYQTKLTNNPYYSYIGEMQEDKYGNLWIATDGGGLSCVDKSWNLIHQFTAEQPHTISHNNVKSICYNPDNNNLYIGMHIGGLSRYDLQTKQFHHYETLNENQISPGHYIYQIKKWDKDLYFSSRNGFFKLNPRTDQLTFLFKLPTPCNSFDIDEFGNLYAVQDDGKSVLWIISLKNLQKKKALKLQDYGYCGNISHIQSTAEGVYLCTMGNGLLFYNRTTEKISAYQTKNSTLPSNYCYNIKQTMSGRFVLTSDKGIILFDPLSNTFIRLDQKGNELQAPIIKDCGIYVSSDNKIFVGDTKGITCLTEEQFQTSQNNEIQLYFSYLYLNNRLIHPSSDRQGILTQALSFTKGIKLNHNQRDLRIKFAHSDYQNSYAQRGFEYKLEGWDKEWTFTHIPEAIYTNLPSGKYNLLARIANVKQEPIQLAIQILPPWYNTWWAWLLYILLAVSLFIYIRRKAVLWAWKHSIANRYKQTTSSGSSFLSEKAMQSEENITGTYENSMNFSIAENFSEENIEKRLSEKHFSDINPLDQELLKKASEIIDRHIDDPQFDISTLCEEIGVGRSSLYSKFKVLTGMTPNNFIINYRLKYAATLLRRYPNLPIAEISDRSGFNSSVYFSQCFKRQYGNTPQNYQKEQASMTGDALQTS